MTDRMRASFCALVLLGTGCADPDQPESAPDAAGDPSAGKPVATTSLPSDAGASANVQDAHAANVRDDSGQHDAAADAMTADARVDHGDSCNTLAEPQSCATLTVSPDAKPMGATGSLFHVPDGTYGLERATVYKKGFAPVPAGETRCETIAIRKFEWQRVASDGNGPLERFTQKADRPHGAFVQNQTCGGPNAAQMFSSVPLLGVCCDEVWSDGNYITTRGMRPQFASEAEYSTYELVYKRIGD